MRKLKGRVATRRVYSFERALTRRCRGSGLCQQRPMVELRRFAARVWAGEGRSRESLPVVVAGNGESFSTYAYPPYNRIELVRGQRNLHTLLHELAHAMVNWRDPAHQHGPRFVEKLLDLLLTYGPRPERTMAVAMVEMQ